MAQGAAQAIEDGATLAACLKDTAFNVPTAFQVYVASRKPRTTILQEQSRGFSKSFRLRDGPEQHARDQTYAMVGLRGNPEAMNRLYGHDAEGRDDGGDAGAKIATRHPKSLFRWPDDDEDPTYS